MKTLTWWMAAVFALGATAFGGTGTEADPYTIAEARALATGTTEYWAQGYIVGGAYNNFDSPWTSDYSISCSDADSESDVNNCLQVKLEADGGRDTWGLATNPGNLGKMIKFRGFRDAYGGFPSFEGVDNADISEVLQENQPPVIGAVGSKSVIESNTLTFTVTATDPADGDEIALVATALPAGATFTGATNAGTATGTFTWENAGPLGDYSATFQATDKDGSDTETVSINVHDGSGPLYIAFQGFEGTGDDTWAMTDVDPNLVLNTTGTGDTPANQRVRTGSYSWQPGEGEYTTESMELGDVDISQWSDVVLTLHVSATTTEIGDGYGMYPTESLSLYLALDGGEYPATADMTVSGNELEAGGVSGALWGFDATGVAATTAGVARAVSPASGGVTDDGIATVQIALPPGTTSVKLLASVAQEYAGYFWNVDDISLSGVNDGGASDYPPTLSVSPDGLEKSVGVSNNISFTISASEIPNDAGDEVRIWATGLPAGATFAGATNAGGASSEFSWTPGTAGSYPVSFYAGDKDGTNQVDVTITVYEGGGGTYAVVVGLNNYASSYGASSLSGCVPDANHIYTNIIKRGEWNPLSVTKLLDSAATKTAIRAAISNYAATAVAGDTFFYFQSSHGGQYSGTSVFLCSHNADYPDTELAADLSGFATGVKVMVMVDACHSGGLFKSVEDGTYAVRLSKRGWDLAGIVSQIMDEQRAAKLAAGKRDVLSRVSSSEIGWITAADYDQYSWDGGPNGGGVFTDKVIEGWTNNPPASCDLNGDNYANFWELYDYSWDVANNSEYEYTTAMAHNTNVLLNVIAGWVGEEAPGGLVVFSNMTAQTMLVGDTLSFPVGAYTAGTNVPVTVTMSTVQDGASYADGQLTFTPVADGTYTFNFTATNAQGGSANAALTVSATLAVPVLSPATAIGNDRFTMNWGAVAGAAGYRLDVATADTFSPGGTGEAGTIVETPNSSLNEGWEYVDGAETASSGSSAYHKLVTATDPGVVSPVFSTVGYLSAAAGFSVATYGGVSGNVLQVSYSLDNGTTWTVFGTNESATTSTYVTDQSIDLPAAALGQAAVRVKWHAPLATAEFGLRLRALVMSGAQAAGGNTLVVSGLDVVGTSYQVTELEMATPYYYRVRATANTTGPLSTTGTATTTAEDAPPSFAAIPAQNAAVGAVLDLNVAGYVSGYPVPSIALVSSTAAGADYVFADGALAFTPSAEGNYVFTFLASNSLGTASGTVDVAVSAAPVLVPVASIVEVSSNSFTVNWTATTGGSEYQVQVATDDAFSGGGTGGTLLSEGFDTLTDATPPAGWTSSRNSGLDYVSSPYYGAAAPSYKFSTSGQTLTSPTFATGATNLQFWSYGNGGSGSTIAVSGLVSGAWVLIDTKTIAVSGATYQVTLDPQTTQLKFAFTKDVNCAMDDVLVTGAGTGGSLVADATLAALTYAVEGLEPETPYYARVRAIGGEWSDVVSATTAAGAESAPVFGTIPAQNATLGALFTLNMAAYVSGSPVPVLSLVSSTASAGDYSFLGSTLSFTPSAAGNFEFVFQASNTLGTAMATATVTVALAPVYIPVASIAGVASDSFTVNWTPCTGATDYQVQVATNSDFTSGGGAAGNLLENGGFETGDSTGWDTFESGYSVVTTDPQEGTYHVTCSPGSTRDLMQAVNITGDGVTEYEVSFWYKKPSATGNARIWSSWATGGQDSGDSLQPTNYLRAATEWTKVTYRVVPRTGANTLNFEVRTYKDASVLWDNFFVGPSGGAKAAPRALVVDETVPALTYPVMGLEPETLYYARVRMAAGEWSEVVSETTLSAGPAAPSFAAIPAQQASVGVPFSLDVSVYDSGNPVPVLSLESSTAASEDYSFSAGTLSFTPSTAGAFDFVFLASNELGTAMATATVTAVEGPVELLAPVIQAASGIDATQFNANWQASAGATGYILDVATNETFSGGGEPPVGGNLMSNAGFETGDSTDWDKFEGEYAVVTTDPQEGSYHVNCPATDRRAIMQAVDITGDGVTEYEISYYYKVQAGDGTDVRIWASWAAGGQASGDNLQPTTYNATADVWTKQTHYAVPQSGANTLNFEVRVYNGATVDLDNFYVGTSSRGAKAAPYVPGYESLDVGNVTTHAVTGLTEGVTYYYRVKAYNASSNSPYSAVTSVVTQASSGDQPAITGFEVPPGSVASATLATSTVGKTYSLQYTTDLMAEPVVWAEADSEAGGGEITLNDNDPADVARYYRVVEQ